MPVAVAAAGKPNGLTAAVPAAHKRQSAPLRLASEASCLPPELWSLVLAQLPSTELQRTALALSRAIPNAGVSLEVSLACLLSASCDFEMLKSISVIASFLAKNILHAATAPFFARSHHPRRPAWSAHTPAWTPIPRCRSCGFLMPEHHLHRLARRLDAARQSCKQAQPGCPGDTAQPWSSGRS